MAKKFLLMLLLLVFASNLALAQTVQPRTCPINQGMFVRGDLIMTLATNVTLEDVTSTLSEYNIVIKQKLMDKLFLGFVDVSCADTKRIILELRIKDDLFSGIILNYLLTINNTE